MSSELSRCLRATLVGSLATHAFPMRGISHRGACPVCLPLSFLQTCRPVFCSLVPTSGWWAMQ